MQEYFNINPIEDSIRAERQSAKRHYGVHPYFTRRPHNVVRKYILHYTNENDSVLDPFGGSGITAIEAFLENRTGIHNDINPLANFIARGIVDLSKGNLSDFKNTLLNLKERCQIQLSRISNSDDDNLREFLNSVKLPPDVKLPSNSDVENYYDLFTLKQLISLAVLKEAIDEVSDKYCKNAMLLAWSSTLGKLNRTFLSAEGRAESRGGSSIFSIYRYKVAKQPVELAPWQTFNERALNVIAAKKEIDHLIELKKRTNGWKGAFEEYSLDIKELSQKFTEKIDYIFTDPPYGGHISYLDLSTLWNSWLGLTPNNKVREKELIVGGELNLREDDYINRLHESVRDCMRMLKPNRWFSVVFQHWNIKYFEAILTGAKEENGHLKAAISQVGDPIWSMHKKKNKQSVLGGEMILTFFKSTESPVLNKKNHFDINQAIKDYLDNSNSKFIYGESLFNHLVIEAWQNASIADLAITKEEFIDILNNQGWSYHPKDHYWVKEQVVQKTLFDL